MNSGKTIFAQLMDFIPSSYEFRRCVQRYRGQYKVKSFSCWDQFLTLAFAQLTYRESLRDIEACLRAAPQKLYHLGIRSTVSRNTLANANQVRDWRIYADFAQKSFVTRDKEIREMLIKRVKQGVETSKRTGTPWALVVPGRYDESLAWDYQTANVIENLKACVEVAEPTGLIIVLEPLNPKDHPGLFLTRIPQAYAICRAVNSPSCKILNDLYHQQITEGNLIPNIDMAWEEIASFHIGDTPGRKEPTTGEINYRNIFKHLHGKGYQGVLCMEHGHSGKDKEGERATIEAYRACDDF